MPARLRLHNVRVPYGGSHDDIRRAAAAKLRVPQRELPPLIIARRSIDTRERPLICWSLAVEFEGDESLIRSLPPNEASLVVEKPEPPLAFGTKPLVHRPLVIGAGPAGLFAALTLAQNGYRPVVVERGRAVAERDADVEALMKNGVVDPESNLLFGEGGAGAYSDGKLTTRSSHPLVRSVLTTLVECGAPEAILIDARPHIGSDLLPRVIPALRARIEQAGGEFLFGYKAAGLVMGPGGAVEGVVSADGRRMDAEVVVLAAGTAARDLLTTLYGQGVALEARPFQIGVRIEHLQAIIDQAVYGRDRGDLPAAEYITSCPASPGSRGVASFCMCPGGIVVPAVSEPGCLSTNGMSDSTRSGPFANSALVVTVTSADLPGAGPLAGTQFQMGLERAAYEAGGGYRGPAQRAVDFLAGSASMDLPQSSYPLGLTSVELSRILPDFLISALKRALPRFERKMPGFVDDGLLIAVEARVSSAVRVVRDAESCESTSTAGLYPVGEGSGYAGGIMTSAVDAIRSARALMGGFSRPSAPERR